MHKIRYGASLEDRIDLEFTLRLSAERYRTRLVFSPALLPSVHCSRQSSLEKKKNQTGLLDSTKMELY